MEAKALGKTVMRAAARGTRTAAQNVQGRNHRARAGLVYIDDDRLIYAHRGTRILNRMLAGAWQLSPS